MASTGMQEEQDRATLHGAELALNELQAKDMEALKLRNFSRAERATQLKEYVDAVGLDLTALHVVHVAGTKGKGSTCAFAESILHACGLRTGMYSSPHMVCMTERYRVDKQTVDEVTFLKHFWSIHDKLSATSLPMPPFFTFLTLVAFHLYLSLKVDILVLEVGLGGKLDATNIVPHPLVCGIAPIGMDHMEILGDTIEKIAREKAGILKANVEACTNSTQQAGAMGVIKQVAEDIGVASFTMVPPLPVDRRSGLPPTLGLRGEHQKENASLASMLAYKALRQYQARTGWKTSHDDLCLKDPTIDISALPKAFLAGLRSTSFPGRCQIIDGGADDQDMPTSSSTSVVPRNVKIFMDGAHTVESLKVCLHWFGQVVPPAKKALSQGAQTGAGASGSDGSGEKGDAVAVAKTETETETILIFACSYMRDPFKMLCQFASASKEVPVDRFLTCPFDQDKLAAAKQDFRFFDKVDPKQLDMTAVNSFFQTSLECCASDISLTSQEKAASIPAPSSSSSASLAPPSSSSSSSLPLLSPPSSLVKTCGKLPWQHVEAAAWHTTYPPKSPVHIMNSVSDCIQYVRERGEKNPHKNIIVLICGSLYLVGNVIGHLHLKVD